MVGGDVCELRVGGAQVAAMSDGLPRRSAKKFSKGAVRGMCRIRPEAVCGRSLTFEGHCKIRANDVFCIFLNLFLQLLQ